MCAVAGNDLSDRISGIRDEGDAMGNRAGATKALGGAWLCVLMLTGCVQINNPAPHPPTTTEPPVDGGTYASVVELRDAMVKAGLDCPQWKEHGRTMNTASSADCSDNTLIATYSSWSNQEKQMDMYRAMGESLDITVLVGANWTINSPFAEKLKDKLGGHVYKSPGKK